MICGDLDIYHVTLGSQDRVTEGSQIIKFYVPQTSFPLFSGFFFSGAFIRTQRICDEEGYTMVICPIARENSFKLDVASYSND